MAVNTNQRRGGRRSDSRRGEGPWPPLSSWCSWFAAVRFDSRCVSNHPNCISMGNLIKKSLLKVHQGRRVSRLRSTADAPHTAAASSRLPSPMHTHISLMSPLTIGGRHGELVICKIQEPACKRSDKQEKKRKRRGGVKPPKPELCMQPASTLLVVTFRQRALVYTEQSTHRLRQSG